jgi:hypothetical protein
MKTILSPEEIKDILWQDGTENPWIVKMATDVSEASFRAAYREVAERLKEKQAEINNLYKDRTLNQNEALCLYTRFINDLIEQLRAGGLDD